jgi:transcriptional regulator with XRE-family HTH domain
MRPRRGNDEAGRFEEVLAAHREFLRRLIRAQGFSLEALDRRFGFRRGYVSRLLKGDTSLTVHHVHAILEAIGISPAFYFSRLYSLPKGEFESDEEMAQRMAEIVVRAFQRSREPLAEEAITAEVGSFEARIERAMREVLGRAQPRRSRDAKKPSS